MARKVVKWSNIQREKESHWAIKERNGPITFPLITPKRMYSEEWGIKPGKCILVKSQVKLNDGEGF